MTVSKSPEEMAVMQEVLEGLGGSIGLASNEECEHPLSISGSSLMSEEEKAVVHEFLEELQGVHSVGEQLSRDDTQEKRNEAVEEKNTKDKKGTKKLTKKSEGSNKKESSKKDKRNAKSSDEDAKYVKAGCRAPSIREVFTQDEGCKGADIREVLLTESREERLSTLAKEAKATVRYGAYVAMACTTPEFQREAAREAKFVRDLIIGDTGVRFSKQKYDDDSLVGGEFSCQTGSTRSWSLDYSYEEELAADTTPEPTAADMWTTMLHSKKEDLQKQQKQQKQQTAKGSPKPKKKYYFRQQGPNDPMVLGVGY